MSRSRDLARNTLILSVGTLLPKLAALVSIPIITGRLTKVEYGTYDLLTMLVALLLPVVTLQIHSAAFRFLIDCRENERERREVITAIYAFVIPASLLSLGALYFALYKLARYTRLLVAVYLFLDVLLVATQQVIRGLSQNKLYSLSAVVQSFANTALVALTVALSGKGLNGVLVSFIVATGLAIALLLIKGNILAQIDPRVLSLATLKQMIAYSWPMIPNTLSNWVLSASNRFVLSSFLGLEATAVYGAANKLPQLFTSVQGTFVFAWQENASLALEDSGVEAYYSAMFDRVFSILTGAMALLIGSTPLLFRLLIRGDYAEAYPQMPILFMGVFFSALASFLGGIYVAHRRTKSVGLTTMIAAAINLTLNFALVRPCGIFAASVSTLASYAVLAAYRMVDVPRFQKLRYKRRKIALCVLLLCAMCAVCWVNRPVPNALNLAFGLALALKLNAPLLRGALRLAKSRLSGRGR